MLKKIIYGILAGILIAIGGSVFLACDNKYFGAVLFSIALLCICIKGYSLFTGKIGFIPEKHGKEEFSVLFLGLLGNIIATFILGFAISYAIPTSGEVAVTILDTKLKQELLQTLIRATFCGILMYLAVSIYREGKNIVGILFCIPVFILSGFEHSIADMFYFATAFATNFSKISVKAFLFILVVLIGNAIGAMLIPWLKMIGKEEK